MNKIVVIGSCAMDLTVLSNKRPLAGETVVGNSMHTSPGGKGANQAVAAAKLGAEVYMVGAIGTDTYGDMILENLEKHHIKTDYIMRREGVDSGLAHIILAEGDNSIIVLLGANATVDRGLIDQAMPAIKEADLVVIQNEIPLATIEYISEICEREGTPLLLNPAPVVDLPRKVLERATFITPNEHELSHLYPEMTTDDVMKIYEKKIIVTMGKEGVFYGDGGQIKKVKGFVVEPVDTTGAGDTFNGAFATAIVNGKSMEEAIRYGNAAAALSITKLGAQQGMPTAAEVDEFLKNQ